MKPLHFGVSDRFRSFRDDPVDGMDESIRAACHRHVILTLSLARLEIWERSRSSLEISMYDELRSDEHGYIAFTSIPTGGNITLAIERF